MVDLTLHFSQRQAIYSAQVRKNITFLKLIEMIPSKICKETTKKIHEGKFPLIQIIVHAYTFLSFKTKDS